MPSLTRHLFPESGQLVLDRALEQRCDIRTGATLRDVDRVGVLGWLLLDLRAHEKLSPSKLQIANAGPELTAEPPNMFWNWIFSGTHTSRATGHPLVGIAQNASHDVGGPLYLEHDLATIPPNHEEVL